jgi:hypothetical protein
MKILGLQLVTRHNPVMAKLDQLDPAIFTGCLLTGIALFATTFCAGRSPYAACSSGGTSSSIVVRRMSRTAVSG